MIGLLGWSNKRPGLEFYRYDERTIPRHDSEWGDLLVERIPDRPEGSPVVVVILPRTTDQETVMRAMKLVSDAVEDIPG